MCLRVGGNGYSSKRARVFLPGGLGFLSGSPPELYLSPPHRKHTRSSSPSQNCIQARQLASTPAQVHPLRTVSKPTNCQPHPFKCTRSELYASPPTGKQTRSSAPAQNCIQFQQLVSTPVQLRPLRIVSTHTVW